MSKQEIIEQLDKIHFSVMLVHYTNSIKTNLEQNYSIEELQEMLKESQDLFNERNEMLAEIKRNRK